MKPLLLIAYSWPPDTCVGANRPFYLARALARLGWCPMVLTVGERHYQYCHDGDSGHGECDGINVIRTGCLPHPRQVYLAAKRMVAIARGLMAQPKLLLLDEPSLGLAPKIVEEVFEKIQEVRKTGITMLIVEQNVVSALSISDRGYVVQNGAVLLADEAKHLLSNEMVRAAYLGL